jgi:hypothetical protein
MHYSVNPAEIKSEIENLGHTITNISNIKLYIYNYASSPCSCRVKTCPEQRQNKRRILPQYKIRVKFEPPKHKWDIIQCANCQRYGHTKKYCYLKPKCVKCSGNHLTDQCHRKEKLSDVRNALCGDHRMNCKGCMIYKDLQNKTFPFPRPKIYNPAQIKQTLYT